MRLLIVCLAALNLLLLAIDFHDFRFRPFAITDKCLKLATDASLNFTSPPETLPILSSTRIGWVDKVAVIDGKISINGWAIDEHCLKPAKFVALYSKGKRLDWTSPRLSRHDVADALKITAYQNSGFELSLTQASNEDIKHTIRVIAFRIDGSAYELNYIDNISLGNNQGQRGVGE